MISTMKLSPKIRRREDSITKYGQILTRETRMSISSQIRRHTINVTFLLSVFVLSCSGQSMVAQGCSLQITRPVGGALVSPQDNVDGTAAEIPPGDFVWVLARIRGISGWYPQGSGPVTFQTGSQWTVFVTYGTLSDAGRQFEVMVGVFDAASNTDLQQWVSRSNDSGVYRPMQLPPTVPTCNVKAVNVTRR
jgi:hypothetical protein